MELGYSTGCGVTMVCGGAAKHERNSPAKKKRLRYALKKGESCEDQGVCDMYGLTEIPRFRRPCSLDVPNSFVCSLPGAARSCIDAILRRENGKCPTLTRWLLEQELTARSGKTPRQVCRCRQDLLESQFIQANVMNNHADTDIMEMVQLSPSQAFKKSSVVSAYFRAILEVRDGSVIPCPSLYLSTPRGLVASAPDPHIS